jgi:disulfide bond formation protein DsbB
MTENQANYPALLALGLIFLIIGYTNDHNILMIVGLLFGLVGLSKTLPQIKNNMDPRQDKKTRK